MGANLKPRKIIGLKPGDIFVFIDDRLDLLSDHLSNSSIKDYDLIKNNPYDKLIWFFNHEVGGDNKFLFIESCVGKNYKFIAKLYSLKYNKIFIKSWKFKPSMIKVSVLS